MIALTEQEIIDITRRRQHSAQERVLKALGIKFKARPDGSLLVLRSTVDGGRADTIGPREPQLRLRHGPSAQVR